MTTKQLLERTGISEPTLRRWLKEGTPVPELLDCDRDWNGRRGWEDRHADAILRYKELRRLQFAHVPPAPIARSGSTGGRNGGPKAKGDRSAQRRS